MHNLNSQPIDFYSVNDEHHHTQFVIRPPLHLAVLYNRMSESGYKHSILMVSPTSVRHQSYDPAQDTRFHQHDFFELMVVIKGSAMQRIEDKEYFYPTGSCCLVNRNITHAERFLEEGILLFIQMSSNLLKELLSTYETTYFPEHDNMAGNAIFQFMKENFEMDSQKYYLDFFPSFSNKNNMAQLHNFADTLLRTMMFPRAGATYKIKSIICELFDYLDSNEFFYTIPIKLNTKNDFLIFSRIQNLMKDTDGRLSRSELEQRLNYSGSYLNSIVKKYAGMSLFDYGTTFCLKRAALLLTSTDLTISEIITRLQFTNKGHFYKLFKNKYGMLPNEYRKKCNSGNV